MDESHGVRIFEDFCDPLPHSRELQAPDVGTVDAISLEVPCDTPATSQGEEFEGVVFPVLMPGSLWKPDAPQFTRAITEQFAVDRKTVQGWFKKILESLWLESSSLKLTDDRYTPLCVRLMGSYRQYTQSGLKIDTWSSDVLRLNEPLQPAVLVMDDNSDKSSTPPGTGRLNLPTIQPVTLAIVPTDSSLLTDLQEPEILAETGREAIEEGFQDLEKIRQLLAQVNAFVESKIHQLDSETEETQQQVQELKDLAFQLEVKKEVLRRAEIRNAAVRQEAEEAKTVVTSKVVNLSDFFAKRSTSQSGS